jgi:hypothetical protein
MFFHCQANPAPWKSGLAEGSPPTTRIKVRMSAQAAAQHACALKRSLSKSRTGRGSRTPPDGIRIRPALTDPTPMRRTSRKKPLI